MLSHIAKLILLWDLIIFHCMHVHNLTLIHLLIDIWVVSTSCLLWIMMWECKDPFGNPGSSSFGYIPRHGTARSSSVFTFWGTSPCRLCCYYCPVARACPTLGGPMDMSSLEYLEDRREASGQRLEANAARPGIVVMWRREESGQRLGIPWASCASAVTNWKFIFW